MYPNCRYRFLNHSLIEQMGHVYSLLEYKASKQLQESSKTFLVLRSESSKLSKGLRISSLRTSNLRKELEMDLILMQYSLFIFFLYMVKEKHPIIIYKTGQQYSQVLFDPLQQVYSTHEKLCTVASTFHITIS